MILRYITIDWVNRKNPKEPLSLSEEEGVSLEDEFREKLTQSEYLRRGLRFFLKVDCVTSMVERLMEPTRDVDFRKIEIRVNAVDEGERLAIANGFCTIPLAYNAWDIFCMDDLGRKEAVISLILHALDVLEEAEGIALLNVRAACAEVKARGYENVWVAARRRSRWRYTAEVEVDYDTNGVRVHMNISDPKGVLVKRVLLAEDQVRPYSLYYQYLGKLAWESKEKVTLTTPSGAVFEVDISDCL